MRRQTTDREREIAAKLAELERSGETVAAFARRHGLSAWTVYDWRRKHGGARRRRQPRAEVVSVEVVPSEQTGVFEVVVGDLLVRVPLGFDDDELLRLVRVVRSC